MSGAITIIKLFPSMALNLNPRTRVTDKEPGTGVAFKFFSSIGTVSSSSHLVKYDET